MICPNCKQENPDSAKFCNACGSPLVNPGTPDEPAKTPPPFVEPAPAGDGKPKKKKKKGWIIFGAIVAVLLMVFVVGASVDTYLEHKRSSERFEKTEEEYSEFKDHVAEFCESHESISLYNYAVEVRTGSIYDVKFDRKNIFSDQKFVAYLQRYTNGYIVIEGDPNYSDVLKITVTYGDFADGNNQTFAEENWDYYVETDELVFRSQSKSQTFNEN